MKRALVTGGSGFLGSYLCERLLADDKRTETAPEGSTPLGGNCRLGGSNPRSVGSIVATQPHFDSRRLRPNKLKVG